MTQPNGFGGEPGDDMTISQKVRDLLPAMRKEVHDFEPDKLAAFAFDSFFLLLGRLCDEKDEAEDEVTLAHQEIDMLAKEMELLIETGTEIFNRAGKEIRRLETELTVTTETLTFERGLKTQALQQAHDARAQADEYREKFNVLEGKVMAARAKRKSLATAATNAT